MSNTAANTNDVPANIPAMLELTLHVRRPRAVARLVEQEDERRRHDEALAALEIGLEALAQARGQVDAGAVRSEVDRLLGALEQKLGEHARMVPERVEQQLGQYLHPESGMLEQRLRGLLKKDGELQHLLSAAVGNDGSQLARTLDGFVGPHSRLAKMIDPSSAEGLAKAVEEAVARQTAAQTQALAGEFSLDNPDGALHRFLGEIEKRHGSLEESVEKNLDAIVKEFSLDTEDSALSRLVRQVRETQRQLNAQLSLDEETSALSRMRQELRDTQQVLRGQLSLDEEGSPMNRLLGRVLTVLEDHEKKQAEFHRQVGESIAALTAKRQADARGTQHGHTFEEAVRDLVFRHTEGTGDVADHVGAKKGTIGKKGDLVITLGPDCRAAGAKIVVEAKQSGSYDLAAATAYLDEAKKNREARVGVFVFSRTTAPDMPTFRRVGDDLYVVWNADDPQTDLVLEMALSVAKALSVREAHADGSRGEALDQLQRSLTKVEKAAEHLDKVEKWTTTIQNNAGHILRSVGSCREQLADEIAAMNEALVVFRTGG